MTILRTTDILHSSKEDAIEALKRVGADYDPRFDLTGEKEGWGKVSRHYGILGNVVDKASTVQNDVLVRRLLSLVQDPDNERLYEKMKAGKLRYTPVNKRMLRLVADDLIEAGVHLPWTWRAMNFDFAAAANKVHRQSPLPFIVFYSQQVVFDGDAASTSRIFSLPLEGHAQGTWAEPIYDELLDPDVGMIIEATAHA